jgi:hypothetical protein
MKGQKARLAGRSGRDWRAGRFIQDVAAAASVATGQTARGSRSAAVTSVIRWRTLIASCLLPRTVQVCIHCREHPAGFWVRPKSGQTARRPWCLSCCQGLDPDRCDVIAFDGYHGSAA